VKSRMSEGTLDTLEVSRELRSGGFLSRVTSAFVRRCSFYSPDVKANFIRFHRGARMIRVSMTLLEA
jgi:hypothetical protein